MGFNNGYDSGYSDCETENRKRWEREAVERYKAENPSGGSSGEGSTPAPTARAAMFFTLSNTLFFDTIPDEDDYVESIGSFGAAGTNFFVSSNPTGLAETKLACSCPQTSITSSDFYSGNHTFLINIEEPAGGWVEGDTLVFQLSTTDGLKFTTAGLSFTQSDTAGFYGLRYNGSSFDRIFFSSYMA